MRFVESVTLHPGCCATCRSSQGPFVDTDTTLEAWGRVYVCGRCATEIGACSGLASGAELRSRIRLGELLQEAETERDEALAEIGRIREAVRTTLKQGGIEERKGEFRLRAPRGKPRVDVEEAA